MATPSLQKHLLSSSKSPSPSSSSSPPALSSSKIKTLVQTFFLSHFYRISKTLTKAKTLVIQVVKNTHVIQIIEFSMKKNKNKNKIFLGSFRLHYNWCSSHVVPVPVPEIKHFAKDCWNYDSSWDTFFSTDSSCDDESMEDEDARLSGYLHWLERKAGNRPEGDSVDDIDRLADMFIADSHEKFRLEKQESYRRFQEMMARSV